MKLLFLFQRPTQDPTSLNCPGSFVPPSVTVALSFLVSHDLGPFEES